MSWEDCGFKPGKIDGPKLCPKGACSDCDGEHHFYAQSDEVIVNGEVAIKCWFACKHCGAVAEMVDEDAEANNQLIAAAEKWLAHYDACVRTKDLGDEPGIKELREAVAKAKGQQP